ncbi:MAG TPA: caspase domain-containing protein [Microvirga sp.]|jgi:uncharacterized caspase-like protein|nr:caspase domain-containing protein [Microvirga sp.]
MKFRSIWIMMVWSLLLGVPGAEASKRVALVIGNGGYSNAVPLPNPRNDAGDVSAALRDLGFDVVEGRDLDRRGMADAVRRFSRKLPGSEVALFFYSGHGVQIGDSNYLLPTDAKIETSSDIKFDTISVGAILEEMEAGSRANLVFLDACRDNPFTAALSPGTRGISTRGLAPQESGIGSLIAFATQPKNVALDGDGRNSPFTQALLKHLKTPGLEVRALLSRVRSEVIAATDGKQVPWENSSLTGDVFLASKPAPIVEAAPAPKPAEVKAAAPRETASDDADTELAYWQSAERIGTRGAFEAYKTKYGTDGRFAALADERIAALPRANAVPPAPASAATERNESGPARSSGPNRAPESPKGQAARKAPERAVAPKPERTATRSAAPAAEARKKPQRPATRQTRAPAAGTAPEAEPEAPAQHHAAPAVVPVIAPGHHRGRFGIGIGLGGMGLRF